MPHPTQAYCLESLSDFRPAPEALQIFALLGAASCILYLSSGLGVRLCGLLLFLYRQEYVHPQAHVTDLRGIRFIPLPRSLRTRLHLFSQLPIAPCPAISAGCCYLLYPGPMYALLVRLDPGLPFRLDFMV